MKLSNLIHKFSLVIAVLSTLFLTIASPAEASANGQQIKILACSADRVIVRGKNAAGTIVTYVLNKSVTNCSYTNITGWWWTGTVIVTAYYNVSSEYPFYVGQGVAVAIPTTLPAATYYPVAFSNPNPRAWIIWRARTWVTDHVPYNQGSTHDGYHQDCSGYASFAWHLKQPGTSPSGINDVSRAVAFDSLLPGDVLNNAAAHTMLFMGWVNQSTGTFTAYEEGNPATGTRQMTFILNKSTGVISQNIYYSYPGTYQARRLNGL